MAWIQGSGKESRYLMFITIVSSSGQKHYINVNHIVRVTHTHAMPTAWPENVYLSLVDGTVIDVDMSYEDAVALINAPALEVYNIRQ
jgi:hypothetical protein